jgi:hypothetical protein
MGDRVQVRGRLRLNDHFAINNHVETLSAQLLALVQNGNAHLARYSMFPREQLALECQDIDIFQEANAERSVDVIEGANDRVRSSLLN